MNKLARVLLAFTAIVFLTACATPGLRPAVKLADADVNPVTVTEHTLKWLPAPPAAIPVAVYGISDQTGAFQPSATGQNLSRAVTQGPTPILIKALQDAGNRRWFSVIERQNLQNLLRERQIILDMRKRYLGEEELNREALPALKFAGVLIEGAITGFDTNRVTGGAGARYLGIGAFSEYREDAVSVYLRAVSVKTGEVLISISTEQRIASVAMQGNAFKFVSFQELLEVDAGITMNQPRHLAVRQAFEKAVYGMIVEGAELGLWSFADQQAGYAAINHYRATYAPNLDSALNSRLPAEFFAAAGDKRKQKRILRHVSADLAAERKAVAHASVNPPARQKSQESMALASAPSRKAAVLPQPTTTTDRPPQALSVAQSESPNPIQPSSAAVTAPVTAYETSGR